MVQSVCLTSRGSGVRIPQLPQSGDDRIGHLLFFNTPLPLLQLLHRPPLTHPHCAEGPARRTLSHAITCIRWVPPASRVRGSTASLSLPLSAAIDLHEIHLAPQPSLQVPVGHILGPGGIKLCSPGTFCVVNYLIINNGSCQVNFTKINSATIRSTNSQWLREDAPEVLVGEVAVPKVVPRVLLKKRYRMQGVFWRKA